MALESSDLKLLSSRFSAFRVDRACAMITALSFLVGFSVYFLGSRTWLGDSHTYLNYAWDMATGNYNPHLYYRTPAYPALMVLLGAASGNLEPLFIFQTAVASGIPTLIYLTLVPASRSVAATIALISIASLVPYHLALTVYPDIFYVAGLVLLTLLISRWVMLKSTSTVYAIAATTFILSSLRPAGLLLALSCMAMLLFRRASRKHAALCIIVMISANVAIHNWQNKFGVENSMLGRQVFFNFYVNDLDGDLPRITILRDTLVKEGGDPEAVSKAFGELTIKNYWYLFALAEQNPSVDRLFLAASIEQAVHHPIVTFSFFMRNYLALSSGLPWHYSGNRTGVFDLIQFAPNGLEEAFPAQGAYRPFRTDGFQLPPSVFTKAGDAIFSIIYPLLVPASFWLMLFGLAVVCRQTGPERTIAVTVFLVHTVNLIVLAALVDSRLRYHIQDVPIAMIGAGIGLRQILRVR